jgi:streptogramin lyase
VRATLYVVADADGHLWAAAGSEEKARADSVEAHAKTLGAPGGTEALLTWADSLACARVTVDAASVADLRRVLAGLLWEDATSADTVLAELARGK